MSNINENPLYVEGDSLANKNQEITINYIGEDLPPVDISPVRSVNGKTGNVIIDKSDIGLPNVDNTSDLDKPVSLATQQAIADAIASVPGGANGTDGEDGKDGSDGLPGAPGEDGKDGLGEDEVNDLIDAKVDELNQRIDEISSDGYITPSEKLILEVEVNSIKEEYPSFITQLDLHNMFDLKDEYILVYNSLIDYIDPILADPNNSIVDPAVFNSKFSDYYRVRANIIKEIAIYIKSYQDQNDATLSEVQSITNFWRVTIGDNLIAAGTMLVGTEFYNNAGITGVTDPDNPQDSVRFWAGAPYENRMNAPFRVLDDGRWWSGDNNSSIDYGITRPGEVSIYGGLFVDQGGSSVDVISHKGKWSNVRTYYKNNSVSYEGGVWVYINETPTSGNAPEEGSDYWEVYIPASGSGRGIFKSMCFKRSDVELTIAPNGGSFDNPIPLESSGWYDGIPPGSLQLYASTRIFTSDGLAPQEIEWSIPQPMGDSPDIDMEWSSQALSPGNPSTNPTAWSNDAVVGTIWLAVRIKRNGVWGQWEVTKIKGENGADGSGGNTTVNSIVFTRSTSDFVSTPIGGSFTSPIPSTAGWSDGIPNGFDPVWASRRLFSSDGNAPQESVWTTPKIMADSIDIDYEWSSAPLDNIPADPDTNPSIWYNDPITTSNWRAMKVRTLGKWSSWKVEPIRGEKGETGSGGAGPRGPFLVEMGTWDANTQYVGTPDMIMAVDYEGDAYHTLETTGTTTIGIVPGTNPAVWAKFTMTVPSFKTRVLIAESANIRQLTAYHVKTSDGTGQRIEINANGNQDMIFYRDIGGGITEQALKLDSSGVYMKGTVEATSGKIGPINITSEGLEFDATGSSAEIGTFRNSLVRIRPGKASIGKVYQVVGGVAGMVGKFFHVNSLDDVLEPTVTVASHALGLGGVKVGVALRVAGNIQVVGSDGSNVNGFTGTIFPTDKIVVVNGIVVGFEAG